MGKGPKSAKEQTDCQKTENKTNGNQSGSVGKNSQILRNPLKFAFLTIFGCK